MEHTCVMCPNLAGPQGTGVRIGRDQSCQVVLKEQLQPVGVLVSTEVSQHFFVI